MIVYSVFDGCSCGRLSLKNVNLKIDKYFASEIDSNAISVSKKNHVDIQHIGDITLNNYIDGKLYNDKGDVVHKGKIDLYIGGSPCQGFSLSGKQGGTRAIVDGEELIISNLNQYLELKKRKDVKYLSQSYLLWEYVLKLKQIQKYNPDVYFLLENVVTSKNNIEMISNALGVQPILINSAKLSAQNRNRYYWANFDITQPEDLNINIKEVLEDGIGIAAMRGRYVNGKTKQFIEYRKDNKSNCLTTVQKDNLVIYEKLNSRIEFEKVKFRNLTLNEMEKLQTMPVDYTSGCKKTHRIKMIGNAWNIDTISHIFECLKKTISNN